MSDPIEDLRKDVDYLKVSHKQTRDNQDKFFVAQGEILKKVDAIHVCLAGTEYDKNGDNGSGGGIVKRVGKLEVKQGELRKWKTQTNTRNRVVWSVAGGAVTAIWGLLLTNWEKLFG